MVSNTSSYFTCIFLEVRHLLSYKLQGNLSRSRLNNKVMFFQMMDVLGGGRGRGGLCIPDSQTHLVFFVKKILNNGLINVFCWFTEISI